jgi:hypothetical protein
MLITHGPTLMAAWLAAIDRLSRQLRACG